MSDSRANTTKRHKANGKVVVFVLGMHRSGTSMIGGVLDRLGCQGARTPLPANERNPKGYFESREIMVLNDAILDVLGSRWDSWQPLDPGWQNSPRFNEFRDRIADVVEAEYGKSSLIYLKDPRMCRLLPLWREVLVEAGYAPVCIHTHRNPVDVTRSMEARTGIEVEPGAGMLLWLRHILDAEAASRGLPRIFTSYERTLANWTEFSGRAERSFGFSWPLMRQARDTQLQEFVDTALRHHDTQIDTFLANAAAPDFVKDCLSVMEGWAETGEDEGGRQTLQQIRERFDLSSAMFARPIAELTSHRKRVSTLQSEQAAAQSEAAAKQEEIETISATLASTQKDLEALQVQQAALQEELRLKNDRFTQVCAERDELHTQEAAMRSELGWAKDRISQIQAEAEERQVKLQKDIDAFADKIIDRDKNVMTLRAELCYANERIAVIQAEAEERQGKLQKDIDTFADKIIDRDKNVMALRDEIKQANDRIAKGYADLHHEYQSSTSWKISYPIRVLGRLLRNR